MKKSTVKTTLSMIWIFLFCGLAVYFVFFTNPEVELLEGENRNTAEKPEFSVENIISGKVDEQTESFLSDRMVFREKIIKGV